jgi:hypothetical protein
MSDPLVTGVRIRNLREELRQLERQNEQEMSRLQPLTEAQEHQMRDMQARADESYVAAGRRAPEPHAYERPGQYERRLCDGLKVYSERWSKANFTAMNDDAFKVVQAQVLADAAANARTHGLAARQIKPIESRTASGHTEISYVGGPQSWFGLQFARPARRAVFQPAEAYAAMSRDSQLSRIGQIVHTHRPPMQAPRSAF